MKQNDPTYGVRTRWRASLRLASLGAAVALAAGVSAQELFHESFTGGASTTGFTVQQVEGSCTWAYNNPGARTISGAGFDADFAIFDSDFCGSSGGNASAYLISPVFDASSGSNLLLSFGQAFRYYSGTTATVEVWDGTIWNNVYTHGNTSLGYPNPAVTESINITAAAGGSATAQVRFFYEGDWTYYWALDEISVSAVACLFPADLAVSAITTDGGTVSWTDNGSSAYYWAVTTGDEPDGTNELATGDGSNTTITGLNSGAAYTVFVRADCNGNLSPWSPGVNFATAITNDDCSGAIALTVNTDLLCGTTTPGTVLGATASGLASTCGGTADDDVWFSFTATGPTHQISLINFAGSTSDMYMALWSGACGNLVQVPNTCSDPEAYIVNGLAAGTTYYLQVYSWTSTPGQTSTFNVCVGTPPPPPANDDCTGAFALTVNPNHDCGTVTSGTVTSATPSNVASSCFGTADDDVWFSFTATDTLHRISLINITGSTSDMYMALWEGDCNNLVLVPNSCSDPQTMDIGGLTVGTQYYLQVYTWTSTTGQTSVFDVCVGTEPFCQPPADMDIENLMPPTAEVTWTDNPDAMEYQWELRVSGAAGSGPAGLVDSGVITDSPLMLNGILADSLYFVYVRSICSVGDTSSWSEGEDIFYGYCTTVDFLVDVEPICNVTFADINNDSPSTVNGSPALEDFTAIHATVEQGDSYTISATGNTAGPYTTYINAFFDWDQDTEFETMVELGSITGSVCDTVISATVNVPADAVLGTTRMRVVKNYNSSPTDPCDQYNFGQAEDYSVDVTIGTGIRQAAASNLVLVPNPANDLIALRNTNGKATQARIFDLVGNLVMTTHRLDAINIANLAPGAYILNAQDINGNNLAHLRFVKQ